MNKAVLTSIGISLMLTSNLSSAKTSVTQTVTAVFDAMRLHQGDVLKAQFAPQALLQRVRSNGSIVTNNIDKFAMVITTSASLLDERLLDIISHRSGNLASVWTPYAFYIDRKISHCGVNSFQLIKLDGQWKIQYLIDNIYSGSCEEFIASHKTK